MFLYVSFVFSQDIWYMIAEVNQPTQIIMEIEKYKKS